MIEKIKNIEKSGSIKDLEFLIENIDSEDTEVKIEVNRVLCNIKIKKAVDKIILNLEETKSDNKKILLTAVCWQSSLDFSPYIRLFAENAVNGSLELTIESMSAIENIIEKNSYDKNIIKDSLTFLKKHVENQESQKFVLVTELIEIMNNI